MNVGIISMQRVKNYGSFLQAYALKSLIESMGHQVRFVDIEALTVCQKQKVSYAQRARYIDRYIVNRIINKLQYRKLGCTFAHAQCEYLGLRDEKMTADDCDEIVIGSDEIFNCASNGPFKITEQRFGFAKSAERVISYAASCGYTSLADTGKEDVEIIRRGITNLAAVSVRDENTADFVKYFREDEPYRHLDPVLVYDFKRELAEFRPKLPERPYMLVYSYHNRICREEEIHSIRQYAKKYKLSVISVGGSLPWCDKYVVLQPFEVLQYFKNAKCIVTDTFHGVVLSAKFNRPFAVLVRGSNANKIEDLLDRLKLRNHKVLHADDIKRILNNESEYEECMEIVCDYSEKALQFLSENL